MKYLLLAILIFSVFGFDTYAQPYETFRISTEKPEVGKVIRFVYTGANSKQLVPRLNLYYKRNNIISFMIVKGKFTGTKNEGSFILPDSILAFCITVNTAITPTETYIFQVYKNGKPMEGSLADAAGFYAGEPYYIKPKNLQKALFLYRQEFAQHPELRPRYLLRYFASATADPDQTILADLERTWQDSLQGGKNEQFLNDLFEITSKYNALPLKEGLRAKILTKYPQGTFALNEAKVDFFNREQKHDYMQELLNLEKQYPLKVKSGEFDYLYRYCSEAEFNKGSISSGEVFFQKIQSNEIKENLYKLVASTLLSSGKNLQNAESYIQTAIEMSKGSKRESNHIDYLYILAQIQHKQGNITAAINSLKTSLTIKNSADDAVIIYHYLKYLMEAKQYDTAFKTATKYIKSSNRFHGIKTILLESYTKVKGTSDGGEEYYNALYKESQQKPVSPWGRMDVKSINFTLKDLDGTSFTLSKQKGKAVVLYFLTTKHKGYREYLINGYFNETAIAYQSRKDVLFIGIDNTSVIEGDEDKRDKLRLERVKKYVDSRHFKFKVLLDELHYHPQLDHPYFKVANNYSVTGLPQFYIIDKKGIVKYRAYINAGDPETTALELSRALNLIE